MGNRCKNQCFGHGRQKHGRLRQRVLFCILAQYVVQSDENAVNASVLGKDTKGMDACDNVSCSTSLRSMLYKRMKTLARNLGRGARWMTFLSPFPPPFPPLKPPINPKKWTLTHGRVRAVVQLLTMLRLGWGGGGGECPRGRQLVFLSGELPCRARGVCSESTRGGATTKDKGVSGLRFRI